MKTRNIYSVNQLNILSSNSRPVYQLPIKIYNSTTKLWENTYTNKLNYYTIRTKEKEKIIKFGYTCEERGKMFPIIINIDSVIDNKSYIKKENLKNIIYFDVNNNTIKNDNINYNNRIIKRINYSYDNGVIYEAEGTDDNPLNITSISIPVPITDKLHPIFNDCDFFNNPLQFTLDYVIEEQ